MARDGQWGMHKTDRYRERKGIRKRCKEREMEVAGDLETQIQINKKWRKDKVSQER